MIAKIDRRKPARIHMEDGQVIVSPADLDVYMTASQKAIEGCDAIIPRVDRLNHFKTTLLKTLNEWAESHAEKVEALYLAEADSTHLQAFVLTKMERYDFELSEEIAAIDLSLADYGWPISIHQITKSKDEDDLCNYLHTERALQIYG